RIGLERVDRKAEAPVESAARSHSNLFHVHDVDDLVHDLLVELLVVVVVHDVQVRVGGDHHLVDHHEVLALDVLGHAKEVTKLKVFTSYWSLFSGNLTPSAYLTSSVG